MAWRLVCAKQLSEPKLELLLSKLQWNLKRISHIFIQENVFEIVVCEMAATLSRFLNM